MINIGVSLKKTCVQKKLFSTCVCKNSKCTESIIIDSMITCGEIIETIKTIPTKSISAYFNEKVTCKTKKLLCFIPLFINYHNIVNSC